MSFGGWKHELLNTCVHVQSVWIIYEIMSCGHILLSLKTNRVLEHPRLLVLLSLYSSSTTRLLLLFGVASSSSNSTPTLVLE